MTLKADCARFVVAVDIDPTHRLSAVLGRTIVAEAG